MPNPITLGNIDSLSESIVSPIVGPEGTILIFPNYLEIQLLLLFSMKIPL